ncbi:MAG: SAM-dependent methyltransferase, partial [Candidatus Odinarchaeia archaeon]
GAAPGGWLTAIKEIVGDNGVIIGVDLQKITPIENVVFITGDITDEETISKIKAHHSEFNVITSDCSPNLSGNWSLDHARQIYLAEKAFEICSQLLKSGGNFIVKVFQGEFFEDFIKKMKGCFQKVIISKPPASRKKSSEVYVIGKLFLGKRC